MLDLRTTLRRMLGNVLLIVFEYVGNYLAEGGNSFLGIQLTNRPVAFNNYICDNTLHPKV